MNGNGEAAANEENGDAEAEEESEGFRGDVGGDEEWELRPDNWYRN